MPDERKKKDKTDANDLVSPKNTERLYGRKLDQDEPQSSGDTTPVTLPETFGDVDQEVGQNMFPSEPEHRKRAKE
jgi:hypothetical protein